MKAYELMALAVKKPEKYEGKFYKVVAGSYMYYRNENYNSCIVSDGRLKTVDKKLYLSVFADTELEEIRQPVPFIEAVKAYRDGYAVECMVEGHSLKLYDPKIRKCSYGVAMRSLCGHVLSAKEILEGDWFIKKEENK